MDEIKKVGKSVLQLEDLHHQYVQTAYCKDFWNDDMSLANSPHVEMMRIMLEHGLDIKRLQKTRYVAEKRYRVSLGRKQWTDDYIFNMHLPKRYKILRMVKNGYKKFDKPVAVLGIPFWRSRFGEAPEWVKGIELWDGHGRTSAMYALGMTEVKCSLYEDANPGSKQWKKVQKELKSRS